MKIKEIRELSTDELRKMIAEESNNIVDLRFSHELKQLTNTAKIPLTRKLIARFKTVLRQRELDVVKNAVAESKGEKA